MNSTAHRSWFWPVQITVWAIMGALNYSVQAIHPEIAPIILYTNFLGISGGGLIVTTVYRYYLKRQHIRFNWNAGRLIRFLTFSALVSSVGWLFIIELITLTLPVKYQTSILGLSISLLPLMLLALAWESVYVLYQLIRQYHNTEVEKWQLEAELQKAQLGTLKSQINPHFMFNTLNNIRALILEDPQQARHMLTIFAETFRHTLQHSEDKGTTVAEEMNLLTQYLQLVKIQYEDRLQYTIQADAATETETIPPMILQLLVENAIKHGIAASPAGGEIIITVQRSSHQLQLSVKNTGTLQQKNQLEDSLGIGLKNITERLRLLYGARAGLQMQEQPPYVAVTIHIDKA